MAYNYLSGEPITGLDEGRPLFLRSPDSTFDLATFMRTQLYASLATLRIGMDVLQKDEGVRLDRMFAHGGLFKTKGVAQRLPGRRHRHPGLGRRGRRRGRRLGHRRAGRLPHQSGARSRAWPTTWTPRCSPTPISTTVEPDPADVAGFDAFIQRYVAALPVERAAVDHT